MMCNPKPLAPVSLRAGVRKLCFQPLGPPPEHLLHGERGEGRPLPNF
jgi:hypothetical protein